jgi:hypothetical protein
VTQNRVIRTHQATLHPEKKSHYFNDSSARKP